MRRHSVRKAFILFLMMVLALALVRGTASAEEETHVVILATSDMHGNILGYSYENNAPTANNGMPEYITIFSRFLRKIPLSSWWTRATLFRAPS